LKRFVLTLSLACLCLAVMAQGTNALELNLERFVVLITEQAGETTETLEPVFEVSPGQLIEERLTVSNTSENTLEGIVLVLPVPNETHYQEGSASTLTIGESQVIPEFSYDGGDTFNAPPLIRTVRVIENGVEVEREEVVQPEAYTHARWILPSLDPSQQITAALRAVVQ
jgi:uncharacterized repeat protein (TIGR01451 family)